MGRRVPHSQAARRAERARHAAAQPGDPRVPRERARHSRRSRVGDRGHAARHFQSAIDQDPDTTPAYLNLGDVRFLEGDFEGAEAAWDGLIARSPERAYLAFDRLERLYEQHGQPQRFEERCRALIAANPQDWRARLALGRHLAARDRSPGGVRVPARRARTQSARPDRAPGDLERAAEARSRIARWCSATSSRRDRRCSSSIRTSA